MSGGEYAHPDSIVLKIVQLDPIHVEVFLPVRLYPRVRLGMIASVEPEAPISGRFEGKVTVIDPVFDVASGTFGWPCRTRTARFPAGIAARSSSPSRIPEATSLPVALAT